MEIQEALKIMRALANGVNPQTGEALETNSVCRQAETVKALNRALAALVQLEQREGTRLGDAGKTWTRTEDAQVCEEVQRGIDFYEIAKTHNRTVGSLVARLGEAGEDCIPSEQGSLTKSHLRRRGFQ
jgi:hypothetical protein